MPVRLGQFYALVLLLACLGINIVFFSEVRKPFFGNEDPLASVQSSLSELDIRGAIAEYYPKRQLQEDGVQVPPPPPPKEEPSAPKAQRRSSAPLPKAEPENVISIGDPLLPSDPPPKAEPAKPAPKETPPEPVSVAPPAENQQTAATMSAPNPAVAAVKPVVADQFKPLIPEPKSAAPQSAASGKPSPSPVWDTIDTVLERPIWYD